MTTASTQGVYQLVQDRVLNFAPLSGDTLNTRIGGRLYTVQGPDVLVYPYVVMRWMAPAATDGYNGLRKSGEFEFQVLDRPRAQYWRAEGIADVIEQCFLDWGSAVSGLSFARHIRRVELPPAPSPMDREIVNIGVYVPVVSWPVMLSQYVTQ